MDPLSLIEEDIRLHEMQAKGLISIFSDNLFNCEHVVPQSWFDKKEPMRGDLHHLFACDPPAIAVVATTPTMISTIKTLKNYPLIL